MSDYTPTAEDVRDIYVSFPCDRHSPAFYEAAFDRWLAEVKAAAWDEGHAAGREDQRTKDQFIRFVNENPHRTP